LQHTASTVKSVLAMSAGGLCTGRQHLRSACPSSSATCMCLGFDRQRTTYGGRSFVCADTDSYTAIPLYHVSRTAL